MDQSDTEQSLLYLFRKIFVRENGTPLAGETSLKAGCCTSSKDKPVATKLSLISWNRTRAAQLQTCCGTPTCACTYSNTWVHGRAHAHEQCTLVTSVHVLAQFFFFFFFPFFGETLVRRSPDLPDLLLRPCIYIGRWVTSYACWYLTVHVQVNRSLLFSCCARKVGPLCSLPVAATCSYLVFLQNMRKKKRIIYSNACTHTSSASGFMWTCIFGSEQWAAWGWIRALMCALICELFEDLGCPFPTMSLFMSPVQNANGCWIYLASILELTVSKQGRPRPEAHLYHRETAPGKRTAWSHHGPRKWTKLPILKCLVASLGTDTGPRVMSLRRLSSWGIWELASRNCVTSE